MAYVRPALCKRPGPPFSTPDNLLCFFFVLLHSSWGWKESACLQVTPPPPLTQDFPEPLISWRRSCRLGGSLPQPVLQSLPPPFCSLSSLSHLQPIQCDNHWTEQSHQKTGDLHLPLPCFPTVAANTSCLYGHNGRTACGNGKSPFRCFSALAEESHIPFGPFGRSPPPPIPLTSVMFLTVL